MGWAGGVQAPWGVVLLSMLLLASSIPSGVGGAIEPAKDDGMDAATTLLEAGPGTWTPVEDLPGAPEVPKAHDQGTGLDIDYRCGPSQEHGLMMVPVRVADCTFLTIPHQEEEDTLRLVTYVTLPSGFRGIVGISLSQLNIATRVVATSDQVLSTELRVSPFNIFEQDWFAPQIEYDVEMSFEILYGGGWFNRILLGIGRNFFGPGDTFWVDGKLHRSEWGSSLEVSFTVESWVLGFRVTDAKLPYLQRMDGTARDATFWLTNLPTSFDLAVTNGLNGHASFRLSHSGNFVEGRVDVPDVGWITFTNLAREVQIRWSDQGSVWEPCMHAYRDAGDLIQILVDDVPGSLGMFLRADLAWGDKHLTGEIIYLDRAGVTIDLEEQAIDAELEFVDESGEVDLALTGLHKEFKVGECLWSTERPMEIEFTGFDIEVLEFSRDPDRSVENRLAAALVDPSPFRPLPRVFAHLELDLWWDVILDAGVLRGTSDCLLVDDYKLVLPLATDVCKPRVGGCEVASIAKIEVCALRA